MTRRRRRRAPRWPFDASEEGLGTLILMAASQGFPFEAQVQFHPTRRWRFDFACEPLRIAVEYEGGIFSSGGHIRPGGYRKDMEKYNEAQLAGWIVLRFGPDETRTGNALNWILRAIKLRGAVAR